MASFHLGLELYRQCLQNVALGSFCLNAVLFFLSINFCLVLLPKIFIEDIMNQRQILGHLTQNLLN